MQVSEETDLETRLKSKALEAKRVIVRIWTSAGNPRLQGENVGHVSIQTPTQYMSLWPKQANSPYEPSAKDQEGPGIHSPISHTLLPSYETDRKYEDRDPEVTYCFYSLDVMEIEKEFDKVKTSLQGWCLLGLCENGESCASLAYRLLQAGGLDEISSSTDQSSISSQGSSVGFFKKAKHATASSGYAIASQAEKVNQESQAAKAASFYSIEMGVGLVVKSPDYLAELLARAKAAELKKYPETQSLTFEGETAIQSNEGCRLM